NLSRPVQIIAPRLAVPWRGVDLSSLDERHRDERVTAVMQEERAERFDPASPPLLRFALIRMAADEHRLVLTNHHILLDGWSTPVLVQELLALYAERGDGTSLPPVAPYRNYLAWLAARDRHAALADRRDALAGVEPGTRLAPADSARPPSAPEQITFALSETVTAELGRQARGRGVTLNTLLQAAWAILLGKLTGRDDVVFGVTVAGRPPELAGIERMV